MRPRTLDEVVGQRGGGRVRAVSCAAPSPTDRVPSLVLLGSARQRQDDPGAHPRHRDPLPLRALLGGHLRHQGDQGGDGARPRSCAASRAGARSSSSTRSTASTARSRTPSSPTSSAATSCWWAPPPRTRRSSSTRRCSRAAAWWCSSRSRSPDLVELLERALADRERGLGGAERRGRHDGAGVDRAARLGRRPARAQPARGRGRRRAARRRARRRGAWRRVAQRKVLLYDKAGEEHFNLISALHKSLRESDPDAALYWLERMLEAGEDPTYVARRMLRFAAEDIGLADPQALTVALHCWETFDRLGPPEGLSSRWRRRRSTWRSRPRASPSTRAEGAARRAVAEQPGRAGAARDPQRADAAHEGARLRPRLRLRARHRGRHGRARVPSRRRARSALLPARPSTASRPSCASGRSSSTRCARSCAPSETTRKG